MNAHKPINILLLTSIFHEGGAEKMTHDIIERLHDNKYRFVMCSLYQPGPWGQVFIQESYRYYANIMKHRSDFSVIWKLNKIIRENDIRAIFIINQPLTLFWGLVVGKLNKIPVIAAIHNTVVVKETLKTRIYRLLLPLVNKIIAVAQMQKDHLVQSENIPEDIIKVIYNGIDCDKFIGIGMRKSKRADLEIAEDQKVVGIVCRLVELKGIDIFLRAASIILQHNTNTQFVIIGDGPEKKNLENLAAELRIKRNVHFLGSRNDIADLIAIFDVAVLSSRTEALPMVILEYMASSKAIVATRVGSVPELIIDGRTGYLVEANNPAVLADRIKILLNDRTLSHSMGESARQIVQKSFRLERSALEMEELFDEVLFK
jgi:glycosyltransferase involved in cell wall biosynthesis